MERPRMEGWCLGPCGPNPREAEPPPDLSSCEESSLSSDTSCSSVEYLRPHDVFSPKGWAKAMLQDACRLHGGQKSSSTDEDDRHLVRSPHLPKVSSQHRARKLRRSTSKLLRFFGWSKDTHRVDLLKSWKQTMWPQQGDRKVRPHRAGIPTEAFPPEGQRSWRTKKLRELDRETRLGVLSVATHGVYPANSHPSPNDSGVSSQSIASSPQQSPRTVPIDPTHHQLATQDSGIYSKSSTLNKSDTSSGRSSPWTPTRQLQQIHRTKADSLYTNVTSRTSDGLDLEEFIQSSQNDFYHADPISCYDYEEIQYDSPNYHYENLPTKSEQAQHEARFRKHCNSLKNNGHSLTILTEKEECRDFKNHISHSENNVLLSPTLRNSKRKSLDQALEELERIYQSLHLNDEMILDGAERRDFPAKIQSIMEKQQGTLKRSFPIYGSYDSLVNPRQRAPRRTGLPDKVRDDAAHRRFQRTASDPSKPVPCAQSYLLCSPAFTPTLDVEVLLKELVPQPDVEHDDLSFRAYKQADGAKVPPSHPPFGIPISPVSQTSSSHYLYIQPREEVSRPFLKPSETPDVNRDDLAFRALRKDCSAPRPQPLPNPKPKAQSTPNLNVSSSQHFPQRKSCKDQAHPGTSSRQWVKDLELLLSSLN